MKRQATHPPTWSVMPKGSKPKSPAREPSSFLGADRKGKALDWAMDTTPRARVACVLVGEWVEVQDQNRPGGETRALFSHVWFTYLGGRGHEGIGQERGGEEREDGGDLHSCLSVGVVGGGVVSCVIEEADECVCNVRSCLLWGCIVKMGERTGMGFWGGGGGGRCPAGL